MKMNTEDRGSGLGGFLDKLAGQISSFEKDNRVLEPGKEYAAMVVKGVESRRPRSLTKQKPGTFVSIRPADEAKTYLGIYIGDLPVWNDFHYNIPTERVVVSSHLNPAIFVPDLARVVYGCESFWGEIKDEHDLREITDEDIENVWYVKALKQLSEKDGGKNEL